MILYKSNSSLNLHDTPVAVLFYLRFSVFVLHYFILLYFFYLLELFSLCNSFLTVLFCHILFYFIFFNLLFIFNSPLSNLFF